jgi:hypothetical protein
MSEKNTEKAVERRTVLSGIATAAVGGMTGCIGGGGGGNGTTGSGVQSNAGPMRDIGYEGGRLSIKLRDGHNVDKITLLREDGSSVGSMGVGSAETKTGFRVVGTSSAASLDSTGLAAGRYEIVALDDGGNELASATLNHNPQVEVVDIVFKPEPPRPSDYEHGEMVESIDEYPKAYAVVENTGNAPVYIYSVLADNPQDPHNLPKNYTHPDPTRYRDAKDDSESVLPIGETAEVKIGHAAVHLDGYFPTDKVNGEHDITENLILTVKNTTDTARTDGKNILGNYEVVLRHHGTFKTIKTSYGPAWAVENTEIKSTSEADRRAYESMF